MGSFNVSWRSLFVAAALALLCAADAFAASPVLAQRVDSYDSIERLQTVLTESLTTFYFLAFGGTVGSFINVVVYRWPRGLGLLWPPSRCPRCESRIRVSDNLPVIGWLRLGGRCRHCGAPISSRYPLVEAAIALMFLALAYGEIMSGGANLPVRPPNRHAGALWTMWAVEWDLIGLFLFHVYLLCTLATQGLLKLDRQATPVRLVGLALIVGFVAPQIWPWLQPVGWRLVEGADGAAISHWPRVTGVIGLCVGIAVGAALSTGDRRTALGQRSREGLRTALGLAGLWLGWQAALSIGLVAAIARFIVRLFAPTLAADLPPAMIVWAAALWQLLLWRTLGESAWWPGPESGLATLLAGLAATTLLSWSAPFVSTRPTAADWADGPWPLD